MNTHALFAYGPDTLPGDRRLPDRTALFGKLLQREVNPLVSLGAEAAFCDAAVETYRLVSDQQVAAYGQVALEHVGVLINRVDRSIKKQQLPHPEQLPPFINENETRSLVWRKDDAQARVLEPLGLGLPTTWIREAADIPALL